MKKSFWDAFFSTFWLIYSRVTKLCHNEYYQETLFDFERNEKQRKLDKTLDDIFIGEDIFICFYEAIFLWK